MTGPRKSKRVLVITLVTFSVTALAVAAIAISLAALRSAPAQLVRLNPDPDAVRPRNLVIMNPLRDQTPEKLANEYFRKLKAGHSVELRDTFVGNTEVMIEEEVRFPPISWRIADRDDEKDVTRISYWVRRGNGYPGEEEALFEFRRTQSWRLVSYNAIY